MSALPRDNFTVSKGPTICLRMCILWPALRWTSSCKRGVGQMMRGNLSLACWKSSLKTLSEKSPKHPHTQDTTITRDCQEKVEVTHDIIILQHTRFTQHCGMTTFRHYGTTWQNYGINYELKKKKTTYKLQKKKIKYNATKLQSYNILQDDEMKWRNEMTKWRTKITTSKRQKHTHQRCSQKHTPQLNGSSATSPHNFRRKFLLLYFCFFVLHQIRHLLWRQNRWRRVGQHHIRHCFRSRRSCLSPRCPPPRRPLICYQDEPRGRKEKKPISALQCSMLGRAQQPSPGSTISTNQNKSGVR